MRLDAHFQKRIARGRAAAARFALAAQADLTARLKARRYADVERFAAQSDPAHTASRRLQKGNFQRIGGIAPAPPENPAAGVAKPLVKLAEDPFLLFFAQRSGLERLLEVGRLETGFFGVPGFFGGRFEGCVFCLRTGFVPEPCAIGGGLFEFRFGGGMADGVVAPPRIGILQEVVGRRDFLKPRLRAPPVRGLRTAQRIRMQFARKPPVGRLDLGQAYMGLDAQGFIRIAQPASLPMPQNRARRIARVPLRNR